jgi:hypothetical protein
MLSISPGWKGFAMIISMIFIDEFPIMTMTSFSAFMLFYVITVGSLGIEYDRCRCHRLHGSQNEERVTMYYDFRSLSLESSWTHLAEEHGTKSYASPAA